MILITFHRIEQNLFLRMKAMYQEVLQYDLEAIAQGKTKKQWVAIMDKKTRSTHRSADGEIIGITEPFIVGGSLLMYPRDVSLGASSSEIVGCRCSVKYI